MANRIRFTKKVLDKLPLPPVGKRVDYFDTNTNHLTLRVSHVGTKAFVLYRKIDGVAADNTWPVPCYEHYSG